MMKKRICLLLVAFTLMTLFACANNTTPSDTDRGTPNITSDDFFGSDELRPDLPSKDMDGKVFTVLCTSWVNYTPLDITDVFIESSSEDGIESKTYERICYMQEKYSCDVAQHDIVSGQELSTILAANRSGDVPYDFGFIRSQNFAALVTAGSLCELSMIPNIDLEKPWWDKASYDSLSLLGKHFGLTSSLTTNDELATWVAYFNKRMISEFQLEDPYQLVRNKEWIYDKTFQMAQAAANDVNNDGIWNLEDRYGISHIRDILLGVFNSSGIVIAENDSEGIPEFSFTDEGTMTKMIDLLTKFCQTNICINLHNAQYDKDESTFFMNGGSLFYFSGIYTGNMLRNMDEEYGILPYPMYNEEQTDYISSTSGLFLSLMIVPNGNNDLDNLGLFLEDYAWYGYRYIMPEFYDILLSQKVAYDEESREMLDIVFSSRIFDTGNIGNYGNIAESLIWHSSSYNKNLSSFIASELPAAQKKIDNLISAVKRWN